MARLKENDKRNVDADTECGPTNAQPSPQREDGAAITSKLSTINEVKNEPDTGSDPKHSYVHVRVNFNFGPLGNPWVWMLVAIVILPRELFMLIMIGLCCCGLFLPPAGTSRHACPSVYHREKESVPEAMHVQRDKNLVLIPVVV